MNEQDLLNFRNEDFLSKEITFLINQLDEKTPAKWGIMTSQHMIEHLTGSFKISNGEIILEAKPVKNSEERLKTLLSDEPFKRNILTGGTTEPKLRSLKFGSMDEAKAEFFKHLIAFFSVFEQNPELTYFHPAYGALNYEQWLQFHYKHVSHHLKQFGLIKNE